jgi:proteasome lid subunit RPN8/RPN11
MPQVAGRRLVLAAHEGAPNEICGFILRDWTYMPVDNVSPNPGGSYEMDDERQLFLMSTFRGMIIGVYHSHPGGSQSPSRHDVETMLIFPEFRHWIVTYNNVYEWKMESYRDGPQSVRRDGTIGRSGLAHAVLAPSAAL